MQFITLSKTLLAALACAEFTSAASVSHLAKRDMCDFIGDYSVEVVVGSGGPGQGPVSYEHSILHIEYQGGVQISPGLQKDAITSSHQTFNPDQTRLHNPITWYADFNLGYKSCTVEYNGQTYHGGKANPGKKPVGTSAWRCIVSFPCEGGISPL